MIAKYKAEVKIVYKIGHDTFITKLQKGDSETFYLHTLYRYIPWILEETYRKHRLGVGVFSMEPYEYKNYTSKRVVLHRTNRKGNIPLQILKLLQLYYSTSHHDVIEESKTRENKKRKRSDNGNNNNNAGTTDDIARSN